MRLRLFLCTIACASLIACQHPGKQSAEDTPANRRASAERYLKVAPPEEMMKEATSKLVDVMPAEQREMFKQMMAQVDTKVIEQVTVDSMVKNFTVSEIDALVAFYGSTDGKSVMKKMPQLVADTMPAIQGEVMKALQKSQSGR